MDWMECHVCLQEFDDEERQQKLLPCGHSLCVLCYESTTNGGCFECKMYILCQQKPSVHSLVDEHMQTAREGNTEPLWSMLWDAEAVCSRRLRVIKSILQENLPRVFEDRNQLEGARAVLEAASKNNVEELEHALELVVQALSSHESLLVSLELPLQPDLAEGNEACLMMLLDTGVKFWGRGSHDTVQQTLLAVQFLVDGELEYGGSNEPLRVNDASASSALLPNDPSVREDDQCPSSEGGQQTTLSDRVDLSDLSQMEIEDYRDKKEEILQHVRSGKVRTLLRVFCHKDADWTMELLRCAKPSLERLELVFPEPRHLQEALVMRKLHTLEVYGGDTLFEGTPPLVASCQPSSLKRLGLLGASGVPMETVLSVLRKHGATLQDVKIRVGTEGDEPWPMCCRDLDILIQTPRTLSTLVLYRSEIDHDPDSCEDQVSKLQRRVPSAMVFCHSCNKLPPSFWFA